jgi:hypothetical protein
MLLFLGTSISYRWCLLVQFVIFYNRWNDFLYVCGLYANKYDRYRYVLRFLMCILFADM